MVRRPYKVQHSKLLTAVLMSVVVGLGELHAQEDLGVEIQPTSSDAAAGETNASAADAVNSSTDAANSEVVPAAAVASDADPVEAETTAASDAAGSQDIPADSTESVTGEAVVESEASQSSAMPPPPAGVEGAATDLSTQIATGERVVVGDRGFSIVPPQGWEVRKDFPGTSLLAQVPAEKADGYQRTIQVMVMDGARFIDDITAEEFETLITRKFSEASTNIEEFRIRQSTPIELADGRPGLLFYSEFTFDGVAMMQAHILVSSSSRHYLLTFTDLAANFEGSPASPQLTEAWTAMTSLEVDGRTPGRMDSFLVVGIATLSLALLIGLFVAWRHWRARKLHEALARGDVELEDGASSAIVSLEPKSLTGDEGEEGENLDEAISQHTTNQKTSGSSKKPVAKRPPSKKPAIVSDAPLSQPVSGEPLTWNLKTAEPISLNDSRHEDELGPEIKSQLASKFDDEKAS